MTMQGMKLNRELLFERSRVDTQTRTVPAALSSEEPILRFFGYEVLDHSPEAVDLSRARPSLPLLFNHDVDSIVGSAESVRVEGGKLRATLHFAETARGEEVFALVRDGHLRGVSVGYQIDRAEQTGELDGNPVFTVRKWTVLESTLTPIPADVSVGIGRSGGSKMDNTKTDPLSRVNEMLEIGEQYAKHGGREIAIRAVKEGKDAKWLCDELLRGMSTNPSPSSPDLGMGGQEIKRYSVLRAINAMADNDWTKAGFERECHVALEARLGRSTRANSLYVPHDILVKRDLSAGTASAGGYLVATDNLGGSFIDLLRARSLVAQLGATILPGLQGNVTIPKLSGAGTAFWLATETTEITESQQVFSQLSLTPKNVGAYTEISRQLMLQSNPAADMLVMNDLAKVVALAVDGAAIGGSGASGQPLGILNTSGIGSVTGTSLGWAGVLEFQSDVAGANGLAPTCAYLSTPAVAALLAQRQRFSSTDTPLWSGNLSDGQVGGYRAASTTQVPAANMIFGDFSQIIIGEWGVLELALNPYANFKSGIVGVRAWLTCDVGVRQAGAFSVATSIT
jgi:HK97 family phage major capsid protein/HK97 family phage prohead protease